MGDYTSIYFLPAVASRWAPDASFVRRLVQRIGADTVYIFSGSSQADLWSIDEEEDGIAAPDLFFESNVPVDSALRRWEAEHPFVTGMVFHSCPWSKQVSQHLWDTVPEDIRGNCHPWSPSILIGPWSVPDEAGLVIAAEGIFRLSLSGDDRPNKTAQYHALFQTSPGVREMLTWLHDATGFSWRTVLDLT